MPPDNVFINENISSANPLRFVCNLIERGYIISLLGILAIVNIKVTNIANIAGGNQQQTRVVIQQVHLHKTI